jgi:TRAP-type C4-dicarboxylate transport system substrate-binding protein
VDVRNQYRNVVGLIGASLLLWFAVASGAGARTIVVKMATLVPQGSDWYTTLQEMGQKWQAASGGQVKLVLYPGGVAGDDSDVVRKIRLGILEAGVLSSVGLADIDRAIFALELPMAYDNYDEFNAVLDKMTPQLNEIYAEKGFIILAWADAGWVHFFTKAPVRVPDDLKSLKLLTWSGDDYATELWRSSGFKPVPLPSTEISTALQTGLVSALPTTSQAAVLLQWYTSARYMTDVNWAVLLGAIVVSKKTWERIPADLRPALLKAAQEAGAQSRAETRESAVKDVDAMEKHGLTVIHLDAAEVEAWRRAAEGAYPSLRGGYVPAAAFDEALKLRDEYRKSKAGKASP